MPAKCAGDRFRHAAQSRRQTRCTAFLTRDGTNPRELLRMAREQLEPYDVKVHAGKVIDAGGLDGHFKVVTEAGEKFESRKLLLATGVRDVLPEIRGLRELYGTSAHHCPYCDGWEWREQKDCSHRPGQVGSGTGAEAQGLER
jgi:thioredoxin reductase